jgi:hypothetical protein
MEIKSGIKINAGNDPAPAGPSTPKTIRIGVRDAIDLLPN